MHITHMEGTWGIPVLAIIVIIAVIYGLGCLFLGGPGWIFVLDNPPPDDDPDDIYVPPGTPGTLTVKPGGGWDYRADYPEPAPIGDHIDRPDDWESPEEEIDRLEARLAELYAADRDRIRQADDALALELLGSVREVEELLAAGTLARADWLPRELMPV